MAFRWASHHLTCGEESTKELKLVERVLNAHHYDLEESTKELKLNLHVAVIL